MMQQMEIIAASSLTLAYGTKVILRDVTISFPGGCVGLLGENGAGKTTFIKSVMGFLHPLAGNLEVNGVNTQKNPVAVKRQIGYMPEIDMFVPGMSAVAFLAYSGQLSGMTRTDSRSRAHRILDYVGIGEERYRDIAAYSTGMKQKIKMAQALQHDPEILILDEPTSGLDPDSRKEMLLLIDDLARNKGKHIIFSTHIIRDIEDLCSSIIVLHNGVFAHRTKDEKTATARYIVSIEGDAGDFQELCSELSVEFSVVSLQEFYVSIPEEVSVHMFWKTIYNKGLIIRKFVPETVSFEQKYLETVKAGMHADI